MSDIANTTISTVVENHSEDLFVTYYPFSLIVGGTLFNMITFLILCRPTFQDTSKRPTLHYMRAIAIFDILMLYGWNLDHYLAHAHGFTLYLYTVASCKFCSFLNYFAPQVSAWLRVFICLDRYLSLSRLHKTWFGQSRSVLMIIAGILVVFTIINFHFFPFVCFYEQDGTVNPEGRLYVVYPLWDYINLGLYNIVPFVVMLGFNSGVIYHLIRLKQTSTVQNSRIQHNSISITLVITTCLFLLMTTPATIGFAFLQANLPRVILQIFDYVLYTYHLLSFPLYFATFREFRQEVLRIVTCNRWRTSQPAAPSTRLSVAQSWVLNIGQQSWRHPCRNDMRP